MRIAATRPGQDSEWAALETEWRDLEARADGSFFQSWTWVGCQAPPRFRDPLLLRATEDGVVVGLALFNRTGPPGARTLHLHETGRRSADRVFIEHNGPLLARGHGHLLRPMLAAALRHGALALSGVGEEVREAADGLGRCRIAASRPAPYAELAGLRAAGLGAADWLAGLGSATRARLRRSRRSYEAAGALVARQAAGVAEALAFLEALAGLHQASWVARGRRGAFAEPDFVAFHRALVARGLPRGEVELLRIATVTSAETRVVGYLYNFRWRDRICAYQSGFDYAGSGPRQSPGLTCHQAAIEAAIASGATVYDFLGGAARYKTSLGGAETMLHWLELARPGTPADVLHRFRGWLDPLLRPRDAPLRSIRTSGDAPPTRDTH